LGTDTAYGAVIKQAKPPKGTSDKKVEAKKLVSKNWQNRQINQSSKMVNNKYAF